jgi:hypothetical protein
VEDEETSRGSHDERHEVVQRSFARRSSLKMYSERED